MAVPAHKHEPEFWFFRPAQPGIENRFKRSNLLVICLLALLVLAIFVAGLGSEVLHGPQLGSVPAPVTPHAMPHG